MNSKFRKLTKFLMAFVMVFTIVGCNSSKSNDEMEKIIKKDKLDFNECPYRKDQCVELEDFDNNDFFIYDKEGLKYANSYACKHKLINKLGDDDKKVYEKFLKKHDLTKNDIENYMKNKYEESTKKYDNLSTRKKLMYATKQCNPKDEAKENNELLKTISNSDCGKLYKELMKNEETVGVRGNKLKETYYKNVDAPEDLCTIIDNLMGIIDEEKGTTAFMFDVVYDDGDTKTLYYSSVTEDSLSGKFGFSYDTNGIKQMALLLDDYDSLDAPILYSGYLVWAAENDVDSVYDGMVIVTNSYNTVNYKNDYKHSLLLGTDTPGFIMMPQN